MSCPWVALNSMSCNPLTRTAGPNVNEISNEPFEDAPTEPWVAAWSVGTQIDVDRTARRTALVPLGIEHADIGVCQVSTGRGKSVNIGALSRTNVVVLCRFVNRHWYDRAETPHPYFGLFLWV